MRHPYVLATILLFAADAAAQRLNVYDPAGPGFLELTAPTTLVPPGSPPIAVYPPVPPLPAPPPGIGVGDSSFNSVTGLNWYTNGLLITSMPTPMYPPLAPPMPPVPVPPAVLGIIGGPVTGMAIDPIAGILWLVSAPGIVVGVGAVPALPIVVPPFPAPLPGIPVTGLDWDGMTGTLRSVNAAGMVATFFPGGALAAALIPFPMPLPGMPMDVAIDKSGYLNAAMVRPIYVLVGPMIVDVTLPFPFPIPSGATPMAMGLAFHPYPAASPPFGVCACPGLALAQGTTGPMTSGNLGFALTVSGLPPGTLSLFAFDFVFNPAFPLVNTVGCGLGFFFASPTLVSSAAFAGPGGTAVHPLPLFVPPGFGPIYTQTGTLCPADPAGFVLTPMRQIRVCGV